MNKDTDNNRVYIHQTTYSSRERLVGFFIFSGFILFLSFLLISVKNEHLFEKRVPFYIEVNSSEGIKQGSIVNVLGTEVGRVSELNLMQGHKIRVSIEVYNKQRKLIRIGAKAIVNRLTTLGSAIVEIDPGSMGASVLPVGTTIPVEETPSLNDLLLDIANLIQSAGNTNFLTKVEVILPKVEQTLENIHKIISQISTGHGVLGAAIFDQKVEKELKIVVTSGSEILSEAEGIITIAKQRLVQLEPILDNAKGISYDLQGATQNLPAITAELNEIIIQARTALTLINGELQDIPGVSLDARRTLSKTEKLLDSAQSIWPLSTINKKPVPAQLIPAHSNHE